MFGRARGAKGVVVRVKQEAGFAHEASLAEITRVSLKAVGGVLGLLKEAVALPVLGSRILDVVVASLANTLTRLQVHRSDVELRVWVQFRVVLADRAARVDLVAFKADSELGGRSGVLGLGIVFVREVVRKRILNRLRHIKLTPLHVRPSLSFQLAIWSLAVGAPVLKSAVGTMRATVLASHGVGIGDVVRA